MKSLMKNGSDAFYFINLNLMAKWQSCWRIWRSAPSRVPLNCLQDSDQNASAKQGLSWEWQEAADNHVMTAG